MPVIVYQMAKVGSSAIAAALDDTGRPVFHVHRMSASHLHALRETRARLGWRVPPVPRHDRLGIRLNRQIIARGRRAKIITLVRDPIARNYSSYFEHLDDIWNTPQAHAVIQLDVLASGFLARFPHDEPLTWFDDEMRPVTGIDVYAHAFPPSGELTIRTARLDLLVLKSELEDVVKAHAVARFLGLESLVLRTVNATVQKPKGAVYRRFLERVSPGEAYVDRMLDSRYSRHFYTPAERERLRATYVRGRR
jgi:hypothetical protein